MSVRVGTESQTDETTLLPPPLTPLPAAAVVDLHHATRHLVEQAVSTAVDVLRRLETAEVRHEAPADLVNRARVQIAGELLHEAVIDDPTRVLPYAWRIVAPSFQLDHLEFSRNSAETIARLARGLDHQPGESRLDPPG
jgi:hypothetical protein